MTPKLSGIVIRGELAKPSLLLFVVTFFPPFLLEIPFGKYNLFTQFWTFPAIPFHEIGHVLMGWFFSPLLVGIVPQLWLDVATYLEGYLFNGISGLVLLFFSLSLLSKIDEGKLAKKFSKHAYSFMFIAYLNLFMMPYTVTHLRHVSGPGLDFTTAAGLLAIPEAEVVFSMWIVNWITLALALVVNALHILRFSREG